MKANYSNRQGVGSKPTPKPKKEEVKIRFIKNPISRFALSYHVGDIVSCLSAEMVKKLVEEKYAVII